MGNYFTSTQIYNKGVINNKKFIDTFCKEMKNAGYVTCENDEAEKSYILRFADNCKWVTITSEEYEEGNAVAHTDSGEIAKMLKTSCVNTTVIDSDCAVMELYDSDGKKADTLIIGRADDYFGENIPMPCESVWKPFLADDSSWEQLTNLVKDSEVYTFIEEGLSELAALIGMDKDNISFNAEDAQEDEHTVFLDFKKANSKKEKKLTLNAAFIKVFGEALEPLGYKRVKGANPYFVRVIGNEIIHVITFVTNSTAPGLKSFEICGDVRSIYNSSNYFSKKPEDAYRESYFDLSNFKVYSYRLHHEDYDYDYQREISRFLCNDDNASIINKMNEALETSQKLLLPFIDSINNIDELYKYLLQYHPSALDNRKELLHLKVDKYAEYINNLNIISKEIYRKCVELHREGYTKEKLEKRLDRAKVVYPNWINDVAKIWKMPELYTEYKKEEEDAKEETIIVLKKFGII